ncbi:MBOAT family O-acyltransferase [Butyrivibrio sp. AE3004]|uniref:MBOAT family O-acyltransferase n=1 Tax=Butyrivibrio sp. AE3004 TaxID=1506994 RepID=UPI000A51D8FF|nr:MBOAT family protein [Butyrivibrio sp. AE3004]
MINFSDLSFIFRFLPIFLCAYYLLPSRLRPLILLVGSLAFYAIGDSRSLVILLAAVVANILLSYGCQEHSKISLFLIVSLDVLLLLSFKFLAGYGSEFGLPLGISFFTFKMVSYQADLYMGKIGKRPGIFEVAAYFVMFPQVISGPIMRYSDFEKNKLISAKEDRSKALKDRIPVYLDKIEEGFVYFTLGFAMKAIIADYLAMMWNDMGTIGYESISTPLAWAGVVCYSLNLYFDFWGYSLMAAGIGVMLGFPYVRNFDHPYSSKSVGEFYRRWHMTLGAWFRDYVYFPMGGSRAGKINTIKNLAIVWLLTGLWHGVTVNFMIWAGMLFCMIVFEKFVWSRNEKLLKIIGRVNVLLMIPITWVIFALPNKEDLFNYLGRMFPFTGIGVAINPGDFAKLLSMYYPFLFAGLALLLPGVYSFFARHRRDWPVRVVMLVLFWVCAAIVSTKAGNPFMYFNF